ncbi:MAG: tyrosine-type recombinase/integrase [Rikenellaceae bacterium]
MRSLTEFIDYLKVHKRYSPRTQILYEEYIGNFYEFVSLSDDENEFAALQPNIIRGFVASGLDSGLSPRTMNLKLSALSSYSNFLVKKGYITSNPVKRVHRPKQLKKLPEFYTQNAIENYFARETDPKDFFALRNRTIISTLYCTGLRRAELANLKISDWDVKRSIFRIVGKGDKLREIPLPITLQEELTLYMNKFKEIYPVSNDSNFFLTDSGQPFYLSFVNKIVTKELGGIEGFTGKRSPHVLRHSIATHLLNNGADLNSIKEVLGHSSLAATQVYTHNSFEQLRKVFLTAHPRAKKGG